MICSLTIIRLSSCYSVAQSYPTLCNFMDWSMSGFPVLHCLLEFAQTHVHWVGDTMQTSYPLLSPSPPASNLSQYQGLFIMSGLFPSGSQSFGASASAWVFQMNIQGWFLYNWLLWSPFSPRNSQESSPTPQFKSISLWCSAFFTVQLSHPYMTTGKTIAMTIWILCQQSNVSGF